MDSPDQNYPRICIEVGLTCQVCTENTARELARACPGLKQPAVSQLFVQIHPYSACAPMAGWFVKAYRNASEAPVPQRPRSRQAVPARIPPVAMPKVRRMAAVA